MAKSLTIQNKSGEDLYPITVSSLVFDKNTGVSVEEELSDKLEQSDLKTVNGYSLVGSGNIVIPKGDKGDPLTYADLTAAQKAELAQPAAEQAQLAAQHLANIQDTINDLDPSQSTEDAVLALTAQLASTNSDVLSIEETLNGHKVFVGRQDIDLQQSNVVNLVVNSNGAWTTGAGSSYVIQATGYYLSVTASSEYNGIVAFFKKTPPSTTTNASTVASTYKATYDTGTGYIYYLVSAGTTNIILIPKDATHIIIKATNSSANDVSPHLVYQYKGTKYVSGIVSSFNLVKQVFNSGRIIPEVESGSFYTATGTDYPTTSDTVVRTKDYIEATSLYIKPGSARYCVYGYDISGNFISSNGGFITEETEISIQGCSLYRMLFGRADQSNLIPADFDSLDVEIYINGIDGAQVLTTNDIVDNLTIGGSDKALSAEQGKILSQRFDGIYTQVDLSQYEQYDLVILSQSKVWATSGKCKLVPVTAGDKFICASNGTNTAYVAFLKNNSMVANNAPSFAHQCDLVAISYSSDPVELTAPSDARYLYMATTYSGDRTPTVSKMTENGIESRIQTLEQNNSGGDASDFNRINLVNLSDAIGNSLHPATYSIDSNGYEIPTTREHLAAMKKAHQLTSLKWTPLLDVPRSTGVFPAGVEVTGLPYSSVKECNKYVGYDVSIHTFMTAVNNPYSLLYTECVSSDDSRSAWGITYHSTGVNPARTYFGQVCSVFASQVCGLNEQWATAYFAWLRNYGSRFSKNYDQSAQGLAIGDVYVMSGHTRCICALKRNSNGDVTHVEVAEAYPYTIKHTLYTAAQFDAKVQSENATIYRSLELYKIKYEPSEYVAIDGETPTTVTYNNDICTFAGDKATFREGDIIVIDYNLKSVGAWTQMELYKDNTLIDTITIDTSEHYVNLTSRNLSYGNYKARMKNGSNYSGYTYWEILQTDVTISTVNGKSTISWISANGKALSYCICNIGGGQLAFNEITKEDSEAQTVLVDLYKLNYQQSTAPLRDYDVYLKVNFQGEYGRVTNTPISVAF